MRRYLLATAGLAFALLALVSIAGSESPVRAADPCARWVVAVDGLDAGTCNDKAHPCETVQYAIDHADPGDRICVADRDTAGETTYNERLTIDKTLYLDGKWETTCSVTHFECKWTAVTCDPTRVELDAGYAGRVVTILKDTAPTIDCFTIKNGDASGLGGDPGPTGTNDAGGGIYGAGADPIIISNLITGNYGCSQQCGGYGRGGGIYLYKATAEALIRDNQIEANVADDSTWGMGGGVMLRNSYARAEGNHISDNRAGNSAGDGGGVAVVDGAPVLLDNLVDYNIAGQAVMGVGGGIYVSTAEAATLEANRVASNQAISGAGDPALISRGGGIYYDGQGEAAPTIRGNLIRSNTASPVSHLGYGGGMYLTGLTSGSTIRGNTLEANIAGHNDSGRGGGLYVEASEVTLVGNELDDNTATWAGGEGWGGGLFVEGGSVRLQDNTFTHNAGGGFPDFPATTVGYGGGVVLSGTVASLVENQILANRATNSNEVGLGGGLFSWISTVEMVGNTLSQNSLTPGDTGFGGGAFFEESRATLDGNVIVGNEAADGFDGRGGGVRFNWHSVFTMTNNIVAENSASRWASGIGLALSSGQIVHNTIVQNTGGDGSGVHLMSGSSAVLYGNIIASQMVGIWNADVPTSTVTADYTLFENNANNYVGVTSTNEVAGPALLQPDYHLDPTSGAIDEVPPLAWLDHDIDGDRRPVLALSDVGADEAPAPYKIFLPVVMRQ